MKFFKQIFGGKEAALNPEINSLLEKAAKNHSVTLSKERREAIFERVMNEAKLEAPTNMKTSPLAFLQKFKQLKFAPIPAAIAFAVIVGVWFMAPAPTVLGSQTGQVVKVSRNGSFQMAFSQRMNQSSVESHFSVTPAVAGSFIWKDNFLTYRPNADLTVDTTYEVVIEAGARNIFGKATTTSYHQKFLAGNYPTVALSKPGNDQTVPLEQTITVLFDEPIRQLTSSLEVPSYLKITPEVPGKYNWLSTSGFEFVPDNGWTKGGTTQVVLKAGTIFADGGSLKEDYLWHFRTESLKANANYGGSNEMRLDTPARASFNYEVSLESFTQALKIQADDKEEPVSMYTITRDDKNANGFILMRNGGYELGKGYSFILPKGFNAGIYEFGLENDFVFVKSTGKKGFTVAQTCPGNNGAKDVAVSFVFDLDNPIDPETLTDLVTVSPALKEMEVNQGGWAYGCTSWPYEMALSVSGKWEPSTNYTLTIHKTLKDIYGQNLDRDYTINFKTNPYLKSLQYSSYSQDGMLASHLPRVYQVRTMNFENPLRATIYSSTLSAFLNPYNAPLGELIGEKMYETTQKLNTYKVSNIDLDEVAGRKLPPGLYSLRVDPTKETDLTNRGYDSQQRYLAIADTALALKRDNEGKLLVWATDLKTGDVVEGFPFTVYSSAYQGFKKLVSGTTGASGVAEVKIEGADSNFIVEATNGARYGIAKSYWNEGISPWNYNLSMEYGEGAQHLRGYIYTDRAIYRPDQEVFFKGVLRDDRDAALSVPDLKTVEVSVSDANGNNIYSQALKLTKFGTFSGSVQLHAEMPTGTYRVTLNNVVKGYSMDYGSVSGSFTVAEYRRPDFKITVTPDKTEYISGDKMKVNVRGEYYSGGPLANAKVNYTVTRRHRYSNPLPNEWFNWTETDAFDCYWYCRTEDQFENVIQGNATLNEKGEFTIETDANLTNYKGDANYVVNVTLTDLNNRQVSSNQEIPVYKARLQVGIAPDYSKGWSSKDLDFKLSTVDHAGKMLPNVAVQAKLSRLTWSNVRKQTENGNYITTSEPIYTPITSKGAITDNLGRGSVSFGGNFESGEYIVEASATDADGNRTTSTANRWVWSGDYGVVRETEDHQMKIVQNKAEYKLGEKAELLVQSPYESAKALITVERNAIHEWRVIDLTKANRSVSIDITDKSLPNVYVSVLAMHGGGETGIPDFKLGYAELQVETSKQKLDLQLETDRPTYGPGDKVTVTVNAKRSNGSPTEAEVSLAVVDERVVSLLGSIDKNIFGRFWFRRSIGVTTADTLIALIKKVYLDTEGGDGKGGADGASVPIRGNFKDTAYWNGHVVTGADGRATVTFTLPENLTTWQLLAIGTTKDTVVGTAERSIRTQKDVMLEPLLPRFARNFDTFEIGATVFNNTDESITGTVKAETRGLILDGPTSKKVSLGAHSRSVVTFAVKADGEVDSAQVKMTVESNKGSDGLEVSLPIKPFSVPESVYASSIMEKSVRETIEVPTDAVKGTGEIKVTASATVGSNLVETFDYLWNFEYMCSEQISSALIASVNYQELVKKKLIDGDKKLMARADEKAKDAIKRLQTTQRFDGGWGYWEESKDSYPYLTAHVLEALLSAKKSGYAVDLNVINNAERYVEERLIASAITTEEKVGLVYVLADVYPARMRPYAQSYYEKRKDLSLFGKATLAIAFGRIEKTSTTQAKKLLSELGDKVVYLDPNTVYLNESGDYGYYMNSDVRSTALYVRALALNDPSNKNLERGVRYMIGARKDGYWETTFASSAVAEALLDFAEAKPISEAKKEIQLYLDSGIAGTLNLDRGDRSAPQVWKMPLDQFRKDGNIHTVGLEKADESRMFVDMQMSWSRSIQNIGPFDNGIVVISEYYKTDDAKFEHPLSEVKQGDTVKVRLRVLTPKNRRFVAVEHMLPAGLEAIDFQLKTSPQVIDGKEMNCYQDWNGVQRCGGDQSDWWEYVWEHTELRDDRVFLFAPQLNEGSYEYVFYAQAVTPGEFRLPPSRAYEFYNPSAANGHNEGRIFKVTQSR